MLEELCFIEYAGILFPAFFVAFLEQSGRGLQHGGRHNEGRFRREQRGLESKLSFVKRYHELES